jgi:hypothetical protein
VNHHPDQTRPLAHAYVRAHMMMTDTELADVKERLQHFAHREGYSIGTVFIERPDQVPAAFHALVEALDLTAARVLHRRRAHPPRRAAQPRRLDPRPTDPVGRLLFNVLALVAEFSVISTRRYGDLDRGRAAA